MDHETIKKAVTEAMQDQMKDFYIEREKHYQHHEFISGLIEWRNSWKSTVMKAVANTIYAVAVALLLMGFIVWGKSVLK